MNACLTISEPVLAVLNASTIEGATLKLNGQLDRALYTAVNKVLELLGGKWNRKAAAHVFEDDPARVIAEALEAGTVVDEKKLYQFYETPRAVADHYGQAEAAPGGSVERPADLARRMLNTRPKQHLALVPLRTDERPAEFDEDPLHRRPLSIVVWSNLYRHERGKITAPAFGTSDTSSAQSHRPASSAGT